MRLESAAPPRFVPSPLWIGVWLGLPLVAAKAAHWDWPPASPVAEWLRDVYVSAHADVAFAAGFGVVAFLLLALTRRWPRAQAATGWALLLLGALAAFYAVASIQIFDYLRSPLTYPLLYLAGDMGKMRSSLGSFLSPSVAVAMVLAPLGFVAAVRLTRPRQRSLREPIRRLAAALLLAGAVAWGMHGASLAAGPWSDRADLLIARSPHLDFIASVLQELRGGGMGPDLGDSFPQSYLADFEPAPEAARSSGGAIRLPISIPATPRPRLRNVLLVVLESTGARYLSLYGSPYRTTPNLEAEAAHALVFDNFYSHVGLTANSMAAMLLSVYPYMTWKEYTQEYPDFPGTTMAQVLKPNGYRTAFFTSAFLDYVGVDRFLQNRGFDDVRGWEHLGSEPINSWGGADSVVVDRALTWIDEDRKRPFFGVVWTNESHHPYDPPAGLAMTDFFAGRPRPEDDYDLGRYLNTLLDVDRQLGRLFAGLRERGLDKDTIVVVTGDHGESFGEPHPTWGHGFRVYQEGVRVPLMIWGPGLVARPGRIATVGGHVDLNPTLVDLLGLPPAEAWEGHSLFARNRPPRAYFYAANDQYLLGVREGDLKYVYSLTRGREELFDLVRDPEERANIAASHPQVCRTLRQRLAAWKHHAALRLTDARDPVTRTVRLERAAPAPERNP
jgi:arylsulfatase A-like enzyme